MKIFVRIRVAAMRRDLKVFYFSLGFYHLEAFFLSLSSFHHLIVNDKVSLLRVMASGKIYFRCLLI